MSNNCCYSFSYSELVSEQMLESISLELITTGRIQLICYFNSSSFPPGEPFSEHQSRSKLFFSASKIHTASLYLCFTQFHTFVLHNGKGLMLPCLWRLSDCISVPFTMLYRVTKGLSLWHNSRPTTKDDDLALLI